MTSILPGLESHRLALRGAQRDDLMVLQEHWNDPLVRRYLFDDKSVDESLASVVLEACLEGVSQGHGLWLLTEKTSRDFVGCVALIPTSVAAAYEPRLTGLLEPMVSLMPARWGQGFATEALSAVLGYAFNTLGLSSLAAANDVPNTASERMLIAAGFSVVSEVDGPKYRLRTYLRQCPIRTLRDDA